MSIMDAWRGVRLRGSMERLDQHISRRAACSAIVSAAFNCETRGATPPRDGRPDLYIDGVRYGLTEPPGGSRSSVPPADALDLRFINGDDVAGVEYYTELSAPAQYRRPGMVCGVVLIWLRP